MAQYAIRHATAADAAAMRDIYAHYVEQSIASFETVAPTPEEMEKRLAAINGTLPWLVCTRNGVCEGFAYATLYSPRPCYRWAAVATIYLRADCRRHGMGRALYTALEDILTALGYRKAYAVVASPYPESEHFHEKMGYQLQGRLPDIGYKFAEPVGISYYCKELLPVLSGQPPEPIPCKALAPARWDAIIQKAAGLLPAAE